MHPDVCGFISEVFYEGRVRSKPGLAGMRLDAPDPLGGTGLRFVPVDHQGNRSESVEEGDAVDRLVRTLLDGSSTWTNDKGVTQPLGPKDILVVAPYNAHVGLLRKRLPAGVAVGTVDKFQGQQAPVVIYSMATSTPEDAPRGMEFLYSGNRLNVAISRARCAAFLVANPRLFDVRCKSERQMALVNAFCRYLEMARTEHLHLMMASPTCMVGDDAPARRRTVSAAASLGLHRPGEPRRWAGTARSCRARCRCSPRRNLPRSTRASDPSAACPRPPRRPPQRRAPRASPGNTPTSPTS